jgi:ABC-type transport system involved in multi-copper enzyme maturation permease subunit
LTGLPILSLLQLWGGVDGTVLLAGISVTVFTLLSAGSVSIVLSVLARDSLQAVVLSYVIILLGSFVTLAGGCMPFSPLGFVLQLEGELGIHFLHDVFLGRGWFDSQSGAFSTSQIVGMTLGFAALHGFLTLCFLGWAISMLRVDVGSPPPHRKSPTKFIDTEGVATVLGEGWDLKEEPHEADEEPILVDESKEDSYPVGDAALLWKEVYHGAGVSAGWPFLSVYGPLVALGLSFGWGAVVTSDPPLMLRGESRFFRALAVFTGQTINPIVRSMALVFASGWCLLVALQAAGCITRERDKRTLTGLLMLPSGRGEILLAKLLGGPLRFRWLGYGLAAICTVGVLTGAFHPGAAVVLTLAVVIQVAFLASFGVWLSLVSRNTLWAYLSMVLMLLLVFAGSSVAVLYSEWYGRRLDEDHWGDNLVEMGLNPLRVWWFLGFSWYDVWEENVETEKMKTALFGVGIYAAMAGILWLAAWQRFRNYYEGK